ncbi:hypothetical protein D3C86_917040 [compost metagenome]
MWFRSPRKGDLPFARRMIKTLEVSEIGPINIASTIPNDEEACEADSIWEASFREINFKAITAEINPINKEPVSPINILAGVRLNLRNPIIAPTRAKETAANS